MTTIIRKRLARNYARSFAAGLVQNAEVAGLQENTDLSEDELTEVYEEMQRIAARIERTTKAYNA